MLAALGGCREVDEAASIEPDASGDGSSGGSGGTEAAGSGGVVGNSGGTVSSGGSTADGASGSGAIASSGSIGGAGGTAAMAGAAGEPATAGAAGARAIGGTGGTTGSTEPCAGKKDGPYCGSNLAAPAVNSRYFCSAGTTLGVAPCAGGCDAATDACIDSGGGTTGGSGGGQRPPWEDLACAFCLSRDCSSDSDACRRDRSCSALSACIGGCTSSACNSLCRELYGGGTLYDALFACAAASCRDACGIK